MAEKIVRCAIYTRKSTEENLDASFNSLDAQREAAENYIRSQSAKGWRVIPELYDDGGYSGGNTKRPGLQKLMADIEAKKIDVVVVYKIDRLSRSLLDFANLLTVFDKHEIAFVSVTQDINTASSAGRMMLNILMTFAQYEREVIAERIRDKMSASRKKGMWVGGTVPFGYKCDDKKLLIAPAEAELVRWIFKKYLETRSPKMVCIELNEKGKKRRDGSEWLLSQIYRVLENYTYIGKVKYRGNVYEGEHEAIIDVATWNQVHEALKERDPLKNLRTKNKQETLVTLKDLVRCGHCGGSMGGNYTKKGKHLYLYYICSVDSKRAIKSCPVRRVSAHDLDSIIVDQMQKIFTTPQIQQQLVCEDLDRDAVVRYTEHFAEIWPELFPLEQYRLLHLLIQQITVFEDHLDIEFRTGGFKEFVKELTNGNN